MKTKTIYAVWSEWSDGYDSYYETYDLAYEGARELYKADALSRQLRRACQRSGIETLDLEEDAPFEEYIADSGLMGIDRVPLFVRDIADD